MKQILLTLVAFICLYTAYPQEQKDYKASLWDIRSDGQTLNTNSIQKAIDYISENGGGRLVFYVGRYLTGTIYLKSNVTLHLQEGAVLLGSLNPFDYQRVVNTALIQGTHLENIGITGKGVIDGRGREVANNLVSLIHNGVVNDPLRLDRPAEGIRPMIICFRECSNILIEGVNITNAASWVQTYDQCKNLRINNITVRSNAYWNNDGLDIVDCENVTVTNSFFDASDDAICLKSHDPNFMCKNILIRDNVARSGANGIKFGTASRGGFVNIKVINNKVYNTFRSAFTIGAVDGATVENIVVDSLEAINTGNVIYLRVGDRNSQGKKASMKNVTISNVYAEVSAGKPDAGYEYEGPVEDLPRNVSPSSIAGLSDNLISDITLKNITIVYPGGGDPNYAKCEASPEGLATIPKMEKSYPEFSQFKELPAWAFFVRHAKNITFENVKVTAKKTDYRPAVVLDNTHNILFNGVTFVEPAAEGKEQVYTHRSSGITVK
ncbi:MAG: glycosyl hydrolase family 28 protein [Bacteroidetes bacterium]|nr:glycosyl hydrolase family 28 protein [Bacteroidota bacterium]MCL1968467.1 glycosyl hydrolase family 28 protein [Bacteroidota bacterium]